MKKHLLTIALIAAVLLIGLAGAASAASVTVAASNSQVKSSAQYVCDGSGDQSQIQAAINQVAAGGGDVYLLDGTFNVAGDIQLVSGVNLIGKGAGTTTLKFTSEGWVQVDGSNTISNLQTTGPTGFFILGSHVKMTNVTVRNYTVKKGAFYIYACNKALSDFTFTNCNAIDGWSHGFINAGEGSPNTVSDITYSGCTAINSGRASRFDPWITGFDFVESTDITNLLVENCRAEGSWESGFHFEESPQKNNVILRNCVSLNNGQKKAVETPTYGAGFIGGSPSMQYIDCTTGGNLYGFHLMDGAKVIRGKDTGSTYAFRTTDYHNIVLTDCSSDQAEEWAFYGVNSHDVTATNFVVTNPKGNPYPAVLAGSSVYPSYNMNIQLGSGTATATIATPIPTTIAPTTVPTTIATPIPTTIAPTTVSTTIVPPQTTGVIVAASNSQVKNTAQFICDGSDDQAEIQAAINQAATSGKNVYLLDGTFNVAGDIHLISGVNLIGKGATTTTLKFVSEGWVQVDGSNTISDLQSTGPTGFFILGSHVKMTNVTVRNYTVKKGAFYIYAYNKALSDFTFTNCNAIDGWSHGFINAGEGSPNSISSITYSGCTAINAGRASQFDTWVTGFDFAEETSINRVLAENCRADGSWESGFYFENGQTATNVILRNCVSTNNGQKRAAETPTYGAGFYGGSSTMQFIDCTSQGNTEGFVLLDGAAATRCKDIGSGNGITTTDHGSITLTDCESAQAQTWALHALNSHDVTATNFKVTNPAGNPYPAILAGSPLYPSTNMNIQIAGTITSTTTTAPSSAPVAQFTASATSGKAPLKIFFTDQSTGNPTSYIWKFGDGTTSTAQNPTHRYKTAGTYTVTEIVKNSAGSNTIVKTSYIKVS